MAGECCAACCGFGLRPCDTSAGGVFVARAYGVCPDCGGTGLHVERQPFGIVEVDSATIPGQSRRKSLVETVTSTAIGFVVSLILTAIVMPAFGYPTTWAHDFWITAIFTVASIVRGYLVRRFFEGLR